VIRDHQGRGSVLSRPFDLASTKTLDNVKSFG
jgi:hypothetical protein